MRRITKILIMTYFSIFISGCAGTTNRVTHGGAFEGMVSSFPRDSFHECVKDYILTNYYRDMHSNIYCGTNEGNPVIPVQNALDHCGQDLSPLQKYQFVKNSFHAYSLSCRWIDSLPSPPLEYFQKGLGNWE